MVVTIQPSIITGTLQAPASKSSMQRACALALLHDGETTIVNPGKSNDDRAALDIIQKLGAVVEIQKEELKIKNEGIGSVAEEINCGESGLGIRMFTPIAALSSKEINITGEGSLLKRPMHFFDEIFPQLSISVRSNNGYLPIKIKGPLQPTDITIDGSLSSQFLTGLLMAFGKAATKPVTITVQNLKSRPYIDLTLQMMNQFGYDVENNNYQSFTIKPRLNGSAGQAINARLNESFGQGLTDQQINCTIEADWSGAAFLLVAGAIAGTITVKGLNVFSTQGDKAILQALMDCGSHVSIEEKQITVSAPFPQDAAQIGGLKAFHFNATDCPDLFPPLVALAAYCEGTSVIEGVNRLEHKESNRAISLQEEFKKMGVEIKLQDDLMMITRTSAIKEAVVHSHHDHRIAMACAVAGLKSNGKTIIEEAEAVNKSYPGFYEDLKVLGANVSLRIN